MAIHDRVLGDVRDQVLCPLSMLLQLDLVQGGLQTSDLRVGTAASAVDLIGFAAFHCHLLRRLLTRPWKTEDAGQQMSLLPCPVKLPTTRSPIKEEEPKNKGQGWFCSSTRDPRSGLTVLHLDRGGWPRAVSLSLVALPPAHHLQISLPHAYPLSPWRGILLDLQSLGLRCPPL